MLMDSSLKSMLLVVCAGIGRPLDAEDEVQVANAAAESVSYILGDEYAECLNDLHQLISQDFKDSSSEAKRIVSCQLAEWNLFALHLIPAFICICGEVEAFNSKNKKKSSIYKIISIMIMLTWDARTDLETTPEVFSFLSMNKEALSHASVNFYQNLLDILIEINDNNNNNNVNVDDDELSLAILSLLRNALICRKKEDADVQMDLVENLYKSNLLEYLWIMISELPSTDGKFTVLLLEISYWIFFMIRNEQEACQTMVNKENINLEKIPQRNPTRSRHPCFGGSYQIKKDPSEKPLLLVLDNKNVLSENISAELDERKKRKFHKAIPSSRVSIAENQILKERSVKFLESCYNALFSSVQKIFSSNSDDATQDKYLGLSGYFMRTALKTSSKFALSDLFCVVLNKRHVNYLIGRICMLTDEKKWNLLETCLSHFRNLLELLECMIKQSTCSDLGNGILNLIFYEGATTAIANIQNLTRNYRNQSKGYLNVLIEINHILLRILEDLSKQSAVSVKKKTASKHKKSSSDSSTDSDNDSDYNNDDDDDSIEEKKWVYEKFICGYFTDSILDVYVKALRRFQENSTKINHCIAKYFHRCFVGDFRRASLCYKLSLLVAVEELLKAKPNERYKELQEFANYFCGKLYKKLHKYPFLLIEMLFPKGASDCSRIHENGIMSAASSLVFEEDISNLNNPLAVNEKDDRNDLLKEDDALFKIYNDAVDDDTFTSQERAIKMLEFISTSSLSNGNNLLTVISWLKKCIESVIQSRERHKLNTSIVDFDVEDYNLCDSFGSDEVKKRTFLSLKTLRVLLNNLEFARNDSSSFYSIPSNYDLNQLKFWSVLLNEKLVEANSKSSSEANNEFANVLDTALSVKNHIKDVRRQERRRKLEMKKKAVSISVSNISQNREQSSTPSSLVKIGEKEQDDDCNDEIDEAITVKPLSMLINKYLQDDDDDDSN